MLSPQPGQLTYGMTTSSKRGTRSPDGFVRARSGSTVARTEPPSTRFAGARSGRADPSAGMDTNQLRTVLETIPEGVGFERERAPQSLRVVPVAPGAGAG